MRFTSSNYVRKETQKNMCIGTVPEVCWHVMMRRLYPGWPRYVGGIGGYIALGWRCMFSYTQQGYNTQGTLENWMGVYCFYLGSSIFIRVLGPRVSRGVSGVGVRFSKHFFSLRAIKFFPSQLHPLLIFFLFDTFWDSILPECIAMAHGDRFEHR